MTCVERDCREQHFGRGAVAELRRAMMFDLPPHFETGAICGAGLFYRIRDQAPFEIRREGFWALDFAEDIEFQGKNSCFKVWRED
jgi:hypothetical protein